MEEFELVTLASGGRSLRSLVNGQTFHPVIGPAAEARAVHVGGTRLAERAGGGNGGMVIWDVGLGAGSNALAAVEALRETAAASVEMLSFDRTDAALEFAIANAAALDCSEEQRRWLEALRTDGETTIPLAAGAALRWRFVRGEFPALLAGPAELPAPHAVFFDPYSPRANPEMWTLEMFTTLRARLRLEAPCLLTSYTRSTAVRVTLLLAGFFVGVGPATGEKDETTVASNDLGLLEKPLGERWLDRAHVSTNAAPLRAGLAQSRAPIGEEDFERLQRHAQFLAASCFDNPLPGPGKGARP